MKRLFIPDHYVPLLLMADGAVCLFIVFFAHSAGIDTNAQWGIKRFIFLMIGSFLSGLSIYIFHKKLIILGGESMKLFLTVSHLWAAVIVIYVWLITFGTFTEWRASTQYYPQLAAAFKKNQLHVDTAPAPELLSSIDPYNIERRPAFDDDIWDLSLYKGKFYLYWGPIPALVLIPLQTLLKIRLLDMHLVFLFFCGLLIFNSLILLRLQRLFFPTIGAKHFALSILVAGLILPIPWSLSTPDVYEAAIGAGQFFLIGGIYFAILAFTGGKPGINLVLTGLFWALSVGSRAINALPIIFLTAFVIVHSWRTKKENWLYSMTCLLTPLILGALLIGWYNWVRFDSPLEFGIRYQITIYNLNRDMPLAFQLDYLPYNLLAYILMPPEWISNFPFLKPIGLSDMLQGFNIISPKLYAAGNVSGLLFSAPFLLFALVPFSKRVGSAGVENTHIPAWILSMLGGSFLVSLITILLYYYGQVRFLSDLISQITLLAILGYWTFLYKFRTSLFSTNFANFLILFTLIAGLLLSVTSENGRMEKLNPDLINRFQNEWPTGIQ